MFVSFERNVSFVVHDMKKIVFIIIRVGALVPTKNINPNKNDVNATSIEFKYLIIKWANVGYLPSTWLVDEKTFQMDRFPCGSFENNKKFESIVIGFV